MNLGDILIKLAAVLALTAFVAAWRWARGRARSERTFRLAYHGMTACLVLASAVLMTAILSHDFRFDYVVGYSSTEMPLIYLISGFWAGQAGTYLLWALFAALIGYPLIRKGSWEPGRVMTAYVPTVGFMLLLMLTSEGNPFRLAARVPEDGRGLNLLLQDPWMASHPPLVFLGYAAMTVPAVLALVALWKRGDDAWLAPALRWSLVAFVFLGAGIILGGFWAYKVLGWGGYWGWDPVENASLIPWLVVTALIHGILVQKTAGALRRTNWALALSGYVLVLYATFLTRSGVLADFSVHSFPAGNIYKVLLGILLVTLGVSVVALLARMRTPGAAIATEMSWPMILGSVIGLFAVSAAFVLVGTSWPMISSLLGEASALEGGFYNLVSLPLYIGLLALLAVGPFLGWRAAPGGSWIRRVVPSLAVAAAGTAAAYLSGARGIGVLMLFFVALAALTSNVVRFVTVARVSVIHTGAALAHVGFALMLVGIVASSSWGTSERITLPLGHPVEALDHIFTFRGHVDGSEPEDRWRVAVMQPGEAETTAHVGIFAHRGNGKEEVFRRPAIVRGWGGDLYIAPLGIEDTGRGNRMLELGENQAVAYGEATLTFLGFNAEKSTSGHEMMVWTTVRVRRGDAEETLDLPLGMVDGKLQGSPVTTGLLPGISLTMVRMSVEQRRIQIRVENPAAGPGQALVAEVSTEPLVGVLWAGCLVLGIGCVVAVARRVQEHRARVVDGTEDIRRSSPRAKGERRRRRPKTAAA